MRRTSKTALPNPTERQEQAMLCEWWSHYSSTKGIDGRLLFAIPNGAVLAGDAKRRGIQMTNLKNTGLRPGVPDLMLAVPKLKMDASGAWITQYHGLFIEMKRKGEKASPVQEDMLLMLKSAGYFSLWCAGADAAMRTIKDYLA